MGTWVAATFRMDPWSYQNLLLKQAILRDGKPDISRAGALRYILRRLRFTDEQKRAYRQTVNEVLAENRPDVYEAIVEKYPSQRVASESQ